MLFNSVVFAVFFVIVTLLYFILPYRWRWLLLLIASCYFYMFFLPIYILILFFTIVIDYFAGIYIEKAEGKQRKFYLIASIITNVGILAIFKYYNFFIDNINTVFALNQASSLPYLEILLPIGLSFHTFQAMSYTIEVYRNKQPAERHFGIYALYVMFYPQLVAGPIERPQNVLHQFREKHDFDYQRVTDGLKLMAWGLFKKVVIADKLALLTNQVYETPESYDGIPLIIATVFFSFQIYCDFSGYSDIALGSAQVMGFRLMKNFDSPYLSKNISEFWSRWHISLSTWFRDYLYIPLGGNRVSIPRWYFNLFIVFMVSGFWHGANWTFIAWGALHGLYLIMAIIKNNILHRLNIQVTNHIALKLLDFTNIIFTLSLVFFAWIFFRAKNIHDALYIATHLFDNVVHKMLHVREYVQNGGFFSKFIGITNQNFYIFDYAWCVLLIMLLFVTDYINKKEDLIQRINKFPLFLRWIIYYSLIITIIFMGQNEELQFIYFQF
jgi:alginate O-acetyltransferase complex protein AlgI